MLNYLNFDFLNYSSVSVLPALFLNISVYIVMLFQIFLVFFMFDTSYLRTVNELKFIASFKKFSTHVLTALLSMAGVPPLMGFCTKFILFILVLEKFNLFFIILFSVFNMFAMFFYIQNFRYLSSNKTYQMFYLWDNSNINYTYFTFLNTIQFFNFFFIFILEDFLFYFYSILFFSHL